MMGNTNSYYGKIILIRPTNFSDVFKDIERFQIKYSQAAHVFERAYRKRGVSWFLQKQKEEQDNTKRSIEMINFNRMKVMKNKNKINFTERENENIKSNERYFGIYTQYAHANKSHGEWSIFDMPRKKPVPAKKKEEKFPIKKELLTRITNLKLRQPHIGQYSPKYEFVQKKPPSFSIGRLSQKFPKISSVSHNSPSSTIEKEITHVAKQSIESSPSHTTSRSSAMQNKIHTLGFHQYASRLGICDTKKITSLSAIDPDKSFHSLNDCKIAPNFSKMRSRKETNVPNYPSGMDYKPNYNSIYCRKSFSDYKNKNKNKNSSIYMKGKLMKLWTSFNVTSQYKLIKQLNK